MLSAGPARRNKVTHKHRILPHMAPHVPGGMHRVKNNKVRNTTHAALDGHHRWLHNMRKDVGAKGSCGGYAVVDQLDGTERPRNAPRRRR